MGVDDHNATRTYEMTDTLDHHRRRSEFIRRLVQESHDVPLQTHHRQPTPKTIVQFWNDLENLPEDVEECIDSWRIWSNGGFSHELYDEGRAKSFISASLSVRHQKAFERCYHPAMQSDYFRLCYLLTQGGCYVDADDVCSSVSLDVLFDDGRLKVQPLCYDLASGTMVPSSVFLRDDAFSADWIFYFNNNPLIASAQHPVIELAVSRSTHLLEATGADVLPEIQETTGPGNLSRSIFEFGTTSEHLHSELLVLRDWDSVAVSKWPLSYRDDARNWRLSNQKEFRRATE